MKSRFFSFQKGRVRAHQDEVRAHQDEVREHQAEVRAHQDEVRAHLTLLPQTGQLNLKRT